MRRELKAGDPAAERFEKIRLENEDATREVKARRAAVRARNPRAAVKKDGERKDAEE